MVERWFAELTRQLLERGDHHSVQALEKDIRAWVAVWNENPKPFVWTKTAEQILKSLGLLINETNYRRATLVKMSADRPLRD
jgi:hypothetical protein